MFRRYNRWWSRFDQPDPYEGSYDLTDPQSFNRYAYVQNDPVNFVDPTGLLPMMCGLFMQYINGDPIGEGYICFGESFPFGGFFGGGGGGGGGTEPQNPAPTPTPTPCPGSIPEDIARLILRVASQEGIDPTLLSVTMRHESSFGTDMVPRERWEGTGRNRSLVGWDVGPMQLATNVWNRSPFTDGLSNPFGTVAMNRHTRQYASFNGDFEENVTVGARAFSMDILARSRSLADAAGLYRAGSRTGPGYRDRFNEYTREASRDRAQLNCLAARR
jgi:hypothetical protein